MREAKRERRDLNRLCPLRGQTRSQRAIVHLSGQPDVVGNPGNSGLNPTHFYEKQAVTLPNGRFDGGRFALKLSSVWLRAAIPSPSLDHRTESTISMLIIRDLKMTFGGRTLFENASFQVNYGERVALVGG